MGVQHTNLIRVNIVGLVNYEWPPLVNPLYDSHRCLSCDLSMFVSNTAHTDQDNNSATEKNDVRIYVSLVQSHLNSIQFNQMKQTNKNNDLLENPFDHPFGLMHSRRYSHIVCTCAGHTALAVAVDEIHETVDVSFPPLEIHDLISDQLSSNGLCLVFPHHYFVPARWEKIEIIHSLKCVCKINCKIYIVSH